MTTSPDIRFVVSHPSHLLATGFGCGLVRFAPGTWGTLLAFPLSHALMELSQGWRLTVIALLFVVGIPACHKTGRALGVTDHGSIVWDEIVAMLLVLEFTPPHPYWWGAAFVVFRLFDIWKPYPIRQLEARCEGGLGVMLDDLLAALYAISAIQLSSWTMTLF
ncbi:MAG: phosphatidylglycerophosphatase A [Methylophilaceae bacterium]|nr:phosphatidylglycerophosphatase A [Methylophilaceae bacterium]